MKFDSNGMRIGTKPKTEPKSSTAYTWVKGTIASPEPKLEFNVDVDNAQGNWGIQWPERNRIEIDVKSIAYSVETFVKAFPNNFDLIKSVMDIVGETSLHELVHQEGNVTHKPNSPYTQADFERVTNLMGHETRLKMIEARGIVPAFQTHAIQVIDLPDEQEQKTVTIGNMTLKVRSEA